MNFLLNQKINAKLLRSTVDNKFLVISKNLKKYDPIAIDSFIFDEKDDKWINSSINNLNNIILKMKLTNIEKENYAGFIFEDKTLVIFYNNELICIDIILGNIQTVKNYNFKSNDDYFIKSTNLINGEKNIFYQISKTNDFIAINRLKQVVYLSLTNNDNFNIDEKILITKTETPFDKIGLLRHILFIYSASNNEISVYNLNSKDKFNLIFQFSFSQTILKFACISDDCEYLATFEEKKILSIFRLKNGKRIAHVPLYNEINSIIMSNYYVVMAMQDKRILSYLLVDPLKSDHSKRISELESRYFKF
jgi:hypothetical protein